jgi:probable HAF family extracellular repeat protein
MIGRALLAAARSREFRQPRVFRTRRIACLLALHLCTCPEALAQTATFTPLADLATGSQILSAEDVSKDGRIFVGGVFHNFANEAISFDRDGSGLLRLGVPPGGLVKSQATDVSDDGTIVAGVFWPGVEPAAFRWDAANGIVGLGDLPGGLTSSYTYDVSADGTVIVGGSYSEKGREAFRWSADSGMVGLGDLSGGEFFSEAWGVSANGQVIVGNSASKSFSPIGNEPFYWTPEEGMVAFAGGASGTAASVSADGQVIVGSTIDPQLPFSSEAYRWTKAGGLVHLGDLPGDAFSSFATDVSADGSIVVGSSTTGPGGTSGSEVFIWDEAHGMRNLRELLVAEHGLGAALEGWQLMHADAISSDGTVIVGWGEDPLGEPASWIVEIPEPSTLLLATLASSGLVAMRLRGLRSGSRRLLSSKASRGDE